MAVISILRHAEFGRNDHREVATHCIFWNLSDLDAYDVIDTGWSHF